MISIQEFIIRNNKYFDLETSFSEVVDVLINKNLTHFPVVENDIFLGNISLDDAETFNQNSTIGEARSLFEIFFVRETSFWFEVLELFSKHQANIIPVLNKNNHLIGYYLFDDIIPFFNKTPFLNEIGTTVIIEKDIYNYSISQISQIFEINNSRILGIIISEIKENKAQIIIKATSININEIIQSLRRYEYDIISEHIEDQFLTDLKDRSDYLDKYLNI